VHNFALVSASTGSGAHGFTDFLCPLPFLVGAASSVITGREDIVSLSCQRSSSLSGNWLDGSGGTPQFLSSIPHGDEF
jgi:hypothetical protein